MQARFGERSAQTYLRNKARRCFPTLLCRKQQNVSRWKPYRICRLDKLVLAAAFDWCWTDKDKIERNGTMIFKKKESKPKKEKKVPVMKVGTHKKSVIALWLVLLASVSFGVYKNFTAIDMHTVHEKEVIEQHFVDTNRIENFVKDFAKSYYSWNNTQESIEKRNAAISSYLTQTLQELNVDTVRQDIPTSSAVTDVKIWEVEQAGTDDFTVVYSVDQTVTEGEQSARYTSAYMVVIHIDGDGNMVITHNPTISSIPSKSSYEPKMQESDGTVDAATTEEVTEFLETFFKLYPTATENELAYYISGNALSPGV